MVTVSAEHHRVGLIVCASLGLVGWVVALGGVGWETALIYQAAAAAGSASTSSPGGSSSLSNTISAVASASLALAPLWWCIWFGFAIEVAVLATVVKGIFGRAREALRSLSTVEAAILTYATYLAIISNASLAGLISGLGAAAAGFLIMSIAFYVQLVVMGLSAADDAGAPSSHAPA